MIAHDSGIMFGSFCNLGFPDVTNPLGIGALRPVLEVVEGVSAVAAHLHRRVRRLLDPSAFVARSVESACN
jgi:hypothetical protein